MRCERTKCICYEGFGNLASRAVTESLICQVYSGIKVGSFGRETDRIFTWRVANQGIQVTHTHAETHILSLEITNSLFWKMLFSVDLTFFFHFLPQCYEGLKAVLLYIYSISVANMDTSSCRGELSSMNVEHILFLILLASKTFLANSRPCFEISRWYIAQKAVIFQVILPTIKLCRVTADFQLLTMSKLS